MSSVSSRIAIPLAITVAAFLAYWPALTGQFVWDDDILLANNALVKASDGLYRMWFTTEAVDYWPMTGTTFWLEWRLWGMNPFGYHVTNLLLHLANAGLLWAALRRLSIPGAAIAACFFALHPVNVESVAWVVQRKNVLSQFFFLLSALWFLVHDEDSSGRVGRWYWLSLGAFVLAMLSKGSVAVLPAALLLVAWWRRGHLTVQDGVLTLPFFAIAAGLTFLNVSLQTRNVAEVIRDVTLVERVLGAAAVVWFYLYKAVLPIGLVFVYPQWNIDGADVRWWLPLAAALAVTAILIVLPPAACRSRSALCVALFRSRARAGDGSRGRVFHEVFARRGPLPVRRHHRRCRCRRRVGGASGAAHGLDDRRRDDHDRPRSSYVAREFDISRHRDPVSCDDRAQPGCVARASEPGRGAGEAPGPPGGGDRVLQGRAAHLPGLGRSASQSCPRVLAHAGPSRRRHQGVPRKRSGSTQARRSTI